MAFSVYTDHSDIFPIIYLKDEATKTTAVIYSFGGLLNAFIIGERYNLIDGFSSGGEAKENITNGFKSCKLSPFVCRITEGKYVFQQHDYKTGKFFLGNEAIHGLIYDAPFDIVDSGAGNVSAFATLQYNYTKEDEGFPFAYTCTVIYRLEEQNKVSITTEIINNSGNEMPLSDGWHPYFNLGDSINDLRLQLNAGSMLEFNDRLVPTGKIIPFNKFQTPDLLGETFLDNCFVLNNNDRPACTLTKNDLRFSIWPDASYPYLQVYTPEHRKSIAIENLSSAPDAFNNGIGLLILNPGETKKFSTTFQAEIV